MFKEIPNFTDYLINRKGVILNKKTRKRLSQNNTGKGYFQVQFKDKKNYYVHRLVALTFIPNPDNKPFVDHIDGDKGNNNVTNLRWVTASENNCYFGYEERIINKQKAIIAENIKTGETIIFKSRNSCANFFKCDKSKIKYGWIYKKGTKKDWVLTLKNSQ